MTSSNGEVKSRVVLVTVPDMEVAKSIARGLVEARLAACVNVLPGVLSIYQWEGEIAEDQELLLVIKTTAAALGELERALVAAHPYDTPEFIVLDPVHVEPGYAAWLAAEVGAR
jgi:periplasmic divalent cation tolerance protein